MPDRTPVDSELAAMRTVVARIEGLDSPARERVIRYLLARYVDDSRLDPDPQS